MTLSVGAAKLTKIHGEFCLAKTGSSKSGILAAQTIEYKGFDSEKARKMGRRGNRQLAATLHLDSWFSRKSMRGKG
jgi:hypothetical protein